MADKRELTQSRQAPSRREAPADKAPQDSDEKTASSDSSGSERPVKRVRVSTGYVPRPFQDQLHRRMRRFNVLVCHRRFGKTVLAVNELIDRVLRCPRAAPRVAYLAPLRKQAKQVAWDYVKRYTAAIPDRAINEAELRIDLPGDRRLFVEGADNPDALRGIYLDAVVLDEFGQMSPAVWREVIRPALADRGGAAIFIGTPKGRNEFHKLYQFARTAMEGGDLDWFAALHPASTTGVIAEGELAAARRDMDEAEYAQEFECSFEAAIVGAYYGKLIAAAEAESRIGQVPWDPALPVHTAWDLGIGDSTAIWFVQLVGREVRLIDYYEASGVGLDHYARHLGAKPYVYGDHLVPHDAEARELGTGKTRVETLGSLGIRTRLVARHDLEDGINAVRTLLPRAWIDATRCARGLETLRHYRREWDDRLGAFRPRPLHDWASHGADALRTAAMGLRERPQETRQSHALNDWSPYDEPLRRHAEDTEAYDPLSQ